MALVKPTLTFELGLTAGFRDALSSVVWTDVTDYVESWSTSRGREPRKPPATFEPGTATLTLNNRGRRFDPTNTAGPYYPNLKPARVRLRIRATWLGVPYDVFTGYIKRWPPEWTASATSTVKITAVDALGAPLNLPQVYGTILETVVRHDRPLAWWRMAETSGTLAADATMNRHDGQYQGSPTLGQASLVDIEPNSKSVRYVAGSRLSVPDKNLIPGYPFTFECWFKSGTATTASKMFFSAYDGSSTNQSQMVQIFISASGADSGKILVLVANPYPTGYQIKSSITVNDLVRHHLVVVFASSNDFKMYLDGTDVTVYAGGGAHSFPNDLITGYAIGNNPAAAFGDFYFGETADDLLAEVAVYDYALSPARIDKHYEGGTGYASFLAASGVVIGRLLDEADWSSADRDLDTGEAYLQNVYPAGGVTAAMQKVEESEQGALFVNEAGVVVFQDRHALQRAPYTTSQVTLGQDAGDQPYEPPVVWGNDDAELFNRATGARIGGPTYTVTDEDSRDEYGERPLPAVTGLLNQDDDEVVDLLTYRVSKYAQPVSSVRQVRLHPAAVPALYPYVLGLGLRSRVTVKVAPIGGGPTFSQESHIERITHAVDANGDWFTTWDVSAAESASYLILDEAVRGTLDSGNLIGL